MIRTRRLTPAGHASHRLVVVPLLVAITVGAALAHGSSADPAGATARLMGSGLGSATAQLQGMRAIAVDLAGRVGLPGVPTSPARTTDPVTGQAVTTVEFHEPDGRLAAAITLDPSGHPVEVVDLSNGPALEAPVIDRAAAPLVARRSLSSAGLAPPAAAPLTTWDGGMDAWCVRWVRSVGTVPAPADGLIAWIHRSGRLKAVSDRESPLAPVPGAVIPAAAATAAARAEATRWHLDQMPGLSYATPSLAWVAPNDFVDANAGRSPTAALHLAWVVRLSYTPPGWQERHLVELDVDAGTGMVIGGTETA